MDLLSAQVISTHLYRHDLESFFWVITWFVATHDPTQHTLGRIDEWLDADFNVVYNAKRRFLRYRFSTDIILSKRSPQYNRIKSTCITPLIKTFRNVETEGQRVEDLHAELLDYIVLNDLTSATQVLDDIRRRMDVRHSMVSYGLFMNLLV